MSAKVILLIDNVHMGRSHDGLALIAKKFGRDPTQLNGGEILMFMNRAKDKLKIMGGAGKVIGYLRMPKGQRIMLEAIQFIPKTFGAQGEIRYEAALREALTQALSRRRTQTGPIQLARTMRDAGITARM